LLYYLQFSGNIGINENQLNIASANNLMLDVEHLSVIRPQIYITD